MVTKPPPRRNRPPEVGAKISATKKGVRQIDLAPGELTLTEAWREFKVGRGVLRDGFESGKLRGRRVERPGRQRDVIVFDREQLREDLARWPCSYPGCEAPAPGRSGRCGDHAARGEPAVELTCDYEPCGRRFTRPVSWLAEREGRGRYCSNECKGKAFDASRPGYLPQLNPDGAREHQARVAEAIAAEGLVGTGAVAAAKHYAASSVIAAARAGDLPSELRMVNGSLRRVYRPSEYAAWKPAWSDADGVRRRARIAKKVHGRASERLIICRNQAVIQVEVRGKVAGRKRGAATPEQAAEIVRLRAEGKTQQQIAIKLRLTRDAVRGVLTPSRKTLGKSFQAGETL